MSASPPPIAATHDTILFRPSKKRKVYRQRPVDLDADDHYNNNDRNSHELLSPSQNTVTPTPVPTTSTALNIPARPAAQSLDELVASSSSAIAASPANETGVRSRGGEQIELEGAEVSMAEILRLRKLRKRIGGGVEFRATTASTMNREGGLVRRDEEADSVEAEGRRERGEVAPVSGNGAARKFAPQTGTVGDVNKHMMAYIDSELAKRRRAEGLQSGQDLNSTDTTLPEGTPASNTSDGASSHPANASLGSEQVRKSAGAEVQRQPATLGKLQEIDLGDEVRSRNILQTERARRRLGGEDVGSDEEGDSNSGAAGGRGANQKGKVRIGRDGKPWRGRKRRGSEDIKRDKLVEEILRENRLEIYDEPPPSNPSPNDDQAADDRIAEAFKREFMDAVSQRQRKKPAGAAPPAASSASSSSMRTGAGGKREEEVLKGPKLGGSRNVRAAMRDAMLKAGAGKK